MKLLRTLPHAAIVDDEVFTFVTNLEIRKAPRLKYPLSILTILPRPAGGGEIPAPRRFAEQLAYVIGPVIRGTDVVRVPTASSTMHVLLVGAHLEHLPSVIQRIMGEVHRHAFRINGERRPVTLSVGGASFPTTAANLEDLLAQADTLARRAREEGPRASRYRLS